MEDGAYVVREVFQSQEEEARRQKLRALVGDYLETVRAQFLQQAASGRRQD